MMKDKSFIEAIIDRFEDEYAVILIGNEELVIKKNLLPENIKRGDVINISFNIDKKTTMQKKNEVKKLLDDIK